MKWLPFLQEIKNAAHLTLVGPLHGREHSATEPTIYVDGGTRFRGPSEVPTVSVGDGDSSLEAVEEILPAKKNYSDLAFALNDLPQSLTKLTLLGFLGGRRDHELLGLGEAHRFLKGRRAFTQLAFDGAIVGLVNGAVTLDIQRSFSLVAFEPAEIVLSGRCDYPFEGTLAAVSTVGLSNEGRGQVTLRTAAPCFLFLN